MKRFTYIIILTIILICFAACGKGEENRPDLSSEEYVYVPSTAPAVMQTEPYTTLPYTEPSSIEEENSSALSSEPTTQPTVTAPVSETTSAPAAETVPSTTAPVPSQPPVSQTVPSETQTSELTTVSLDIELPDANGTMVVDTSPGNKFIAAVTGSGKTDASLLAAVYAVPESGQNYVFEFYDSAGRSKDDLRRVYLMDAAGNITSVAAAKASEKVNISSTENWFCFNVLIKGVIFDAIAEDL